MTRTAGIVLRLARAGDYEGRRQNGGNWLYAGSSGTTSLTSAATAISAGNRPTAAGTYKGTVTITPAVTVNKVNATVYGCALAAGYAGLYQVAIQVPTTLSAGTYPIVATMGQVGLDEGSSPSTVALVVQ